MPSIGEDAVEVREGDAPAMIARRVVGDALGRQIHGDFKIGDERCARRLADLDRVAQVIVMTMGQKHMRSAARNFSQLRP